MKRKLIRYAGRRPATSAKSPVRDGAMAWTIMKTVTDKLMTGMDVPYVDARTGRAGNMLVEERGEKRPPRHDTRTIKFF